MRRFRPHGSPPGLTTPVTPDDASHPRRADRAAPTGPAAPMAPAAPTAPPRRSAPPTLTLTTLPAMLLPARMPARGRRPPRLLLMTLAVLVIAAVLAVAATAATSASHPKTTTPPKVAAVPQGFVGMDADGPLFGSDNNIDFGKQLSTMVADGVQSLRVAFSWSAAEPYQNWSDVPNDVKPQFTNVAGQPVNFQVTDAIVGDVARDRVTVLPTVLYAPSWDAKSNSNGVATPRSNAPYGTFLTALIGRYGPRGSFWRDNPGIPKLPIRMWQIWNEPNLSYYWKQPFAASYVGLLRVAHNAIKHADPGAKVVLGALTNTAWKSLGQVYRVSGARNLFDVVAFNGFTKIPANVMEFMLFMRRAMDHFGDGAKPMLATEVSWPSAKGKTHDKFDFITTPAGQASDLAALLPLIGQERVSLGLIGFYWYTWMGEEDPGTTAFNFSGLLGFHNGKVTVKPALGAFRKGVLALEGCRSKGSVATSCVR
jgi:hypothetical protein